MSQSNDQQSNVAKSEPEHKPAQQDPSLKTDSDFEPLPESAASKKWDHPKWVDTFSQWLNDNKRHEVKNLIDFFDRSSEWWAAAKELTSDEFSQKSMFLKRDLMMFYRHYQQDLDQSPFIQAIKESVWKELAEMTDKSQIEWQELEQDFRHKGTYETGEWVGMGVIVCKACHNQLTFVHPLILAECPQCGGTHFLREALAP